MKVIEVMGEENKEGLRWLKTWGQEGPSDLKIDNLAPDFLAPWVNLFGDIVKSVINLAPLGPTWPLTWPLMKKRGKNYGTQEQ